MKDDTISRAAALDALDKVAEMFPYRIPGKAKTYRQYNEAWSDAIDAAENALEALPSAQPGWIPCSVALPTKEGVYLVTDKSAFGEKISMRYWNIHEKDAFWSGYESDVVLAWQLLPKPYREGGQL